MPSNVIAKAFEMSEKRTLPKELRSENSEMPALAFSAADTRDEMQQHVAAVVDISPHRNRKAALAFAAKLLRPPVCRVKALYYGEARRIEAHEADQVRAYVQQAEKLMGARAEYERYRQEFLAANPALSRFAPGPLADTKAKADGVVAVVEEAGRRIAEFSK